MNRREWMVWASAAGLGGASTLASAQARRYEPEPGDWRRFEVTTTVELRDGKGATRVWVPLPAVDREFQQSMDHQWSTNANQARVMSDPRFGASMLVADFDAGIAQPRLAVTSSVRTRSRAVDWQRPQPANEDAATLDRWIQPTELMPTDGIVRSTAREAIGDARTDEEKVRRLYDWVVSRTYREPKVRGCGVGDIKTMLETGNLSGKCADINALFVGLCRAAGIPARDIYGVRLVPSEFGYKELGANPASLKGAQHCRAEVYLKGHGWVAMDPADVTKVMRQETPEWIKDAGHPIVAPVRKALFGSWEGNWMGYNSASDIALPGAKQKKLAFFM